MMRIVSLQPSATAILARLGARDRLVACTKWCRDVCPELDAALPIVADSWSASREQILAARPDLVIASVPYRQESLAEILKAGVPLLALAPRSLADIYRDIALIAATVNAAERGQVVISEMQREIEAVAQRTAGLPRPRVFCEEWGKPIIHSQHWVAELVDAAGGSFLGESGAQTDAAAVLAQDPEVVIAAWCGAGDRVPLEKLVRERGWQQMTAVISGRVFCLRDELLNTPAPTLIAGLHALAAAIHPDVFSPVPGMRRIAAGGSK